MGITSLRLPPDSSTSSSPTCATPVTRSARTTIATGATTTLARTGLIEPQGLVIDSSGRIFVSGDLADLIIELTPRGVSPTL